jgi:hypothetical protein
MDAEEITQLRNPKQIGNFFMMRVQIYQNKFLVAIPGSKSFENDYCKILNEDTLKLI